MAAKKKVVKKPVAQKQPPKKYYDILHHEDPQALIAEVERWIDKGWRPVGGANFSPDGYFQSITKVR